MIRITSATTFVIMVTQAFVVTVLPETTVFCKPIIATVAVICGEITPS